MKISRRKLIESGSVSALSFGGIGSSNKMFGTIPSFEQEPDLLPESNVLPLAKRAVEAAMSAGAAYADARIVRYVRQGFIFKEETIGNTESTDTEDIGFGVRVLVNGCFGFAASPYIDLEEAAILAKNAIDQAKANAAIRPRELNWMSVPAQKGRWICPGEDPFLVPIEERVEFINAWREDVKGYRDGVNATKLTDSRALFSRWEKFLVTSDGTEVSQVIYNTGGSLVFAALPRFGQPLSGPHVGNVNGIQNQQGGWEVFKKAKAKEQVPELVANAVENSKVGVGTFDVGRYDLVLDGSFVANLIGRTFGISTQLDLALGYEANAGGTSYLGPDTREFLGTQVAHQSVTIRCNRSAPGRLATAKWDDEGVVPKEFDLVRDGNLVNYQTTRDNSSKLNDWFQKSKIEPGSQGCSNVQSGLNIPIQATPNLEMMPNVSATSLSDMISEVKRGYVVYGGTVSTSFNIKEGLATPGMIREIRNGKLLDFIPGFQIMFSTPEIWKNITMMGDRTTLRQGSSRSNKGEPSQSYDYDVDAVALSVKDVPLIDPARKA